MTTKLRSESNQGQQRPLLTIAVPTYNRASNLRLLLENLAPQLGDETRVELIISDNCSPDDTLSVVNEFISAGLACRYIRNEVNIGPDGNFLQCYDVAAGQYLWIFSDDDVIFPGSIAFLLCQLERADYDLVYLKPFGFFREPNERGHATVTPRTKEFSRAPDFIHAVGLNGDFALISSVIVNKRRVDSIAHLPFTEGRSTNLIQLGWV